MLTLSEVTYRVGGRTGRRLLDNAHAQIYEGSKVGLVGRNGAGKSTLLDLIRGVLQPDGGSIELPRGYRTGFLAQEAPSGEASALETVLAADAERAGLLAEREAGAEPARRRMGIDFDEPGGAHPRRARPRRGDAVGAHRGSVGW